MFDDTQVAAVDDDGYGGLYHKTTLVVFTDDIQQQIDPQLFYPTDIIKVFLQPLSLYSLYLSLTQAHPIRAADMNELFTSLTHCAQRERMRSPVAKFSCHEL